MNRIKGTIRWMDKLRGEGQVRLETGKSVWIYLCNVQGADSHYPEFVTSVKLEAGDLVEGTVSDDPTLRSLGLINVVKL